MTDSSDEQGEQATATSREYDYQEPVARLLNLGAGYEEWPDYQQLGLGPEHVPKLIRMVQDEALHWLNADETLDGWALVHAWRTLGQLRAPEAVEPLLSLLDPMEEMDWLREELPQVMALIGPQALAALSAYLTDRTHKLWSRITVASALQKVAAQHPEARDRSVAALTRQLTGFADEDPILNAYVVLSLAELKAVEAAPLIEQAFAAEVVDESLMGDWPQVQYELGLLAERPEYVPSPKWHPFYQMFGRRGAAEEVAPVEAAGSATPTPTGPHRHDKQKKAKRKQQKAARKRNRKN